MQLNPTFLFLPLAALVLAKSGDRRIPQVEIRTSDASVEVTGADVDRVTLLDSQATVEDAEGRVVVSNEGREEGALRVQVPRGSSVSVLTSNAPIHVAGVAGLLRLTSSNAAITVDDAGPAEIHAHTSNGRIDVTLPQARDANLSAQTSNGRIDSELEVTANRLSSSSLYGKIGDGGPPIDLQTSNGSIYLKSARDRESVHSTFRSGEVK